MTLISDSWLESAAPAAPPAAAATTANAKSAVATPMPAATPARGPDAIEASISSRLTAPTCTAIARPATRPASNAVVGSMDAFFRPPPRGLQALAAVDRDTRGDGRDRQRDPPPAP